MVFTARMLKLGGIMNSRTTNTSVSDSNTIRRGSRRLSTLTAACATALLLGVGVASAAPQEESLLFSVKVDSITAADGAATGAWASYMPSGKTFATMGNPKMKTVGGVKWVKNLRDSSDGYQVVNDGTPIPCSGVTIVAAVKPIYWTGGGEARGEIVDIFYNRLALAISHADGRIMVCRNYWNDWGPSIPNGQSTVLSLVVQADGSYAVFANGVSVMTGGANGDFNTLTPPDGWKSWIAIGRNAWDGWSSYNGHLGDVYVYKTALGTADRETLEAELTTKFVTAPVNYTITPNAGTGGTISPEAAVLIPECYDKSFTITPGKYFDVASVLVDDGTGATEKVAGPNAQTYTFLNVTNNGTIDATFTEWTETYITGTVTTDGTTGVPGVLITATGGREPYTTTTSDPDGTYSFRVKPGVNYTLKAKKSQYSMAPSSQDVLAGGTANFTATFVGVQAIVVLDAKSLADADGTRVLSWANTGSLGGVFNKKAQGPGPSIATINGKKAVLFNPSGEGDNVSETLGGTIVTPDALAGNSSWTVFTELYRADMGWNGDSAYLSLAGNQNGGNRGAEFCYVNNKAVDHCYSGWGFNNVPSAGAWHNVTITYDGTTEKIYVDGVLDASRNIALNIAAGDQILIGSHSDVTGSTRLWNDNYWRYRGAIAKLQIFDAALTQDKIIELIKGPPKGTVLMLF